MSSFKYELDVLSPLHIGSGKRIHPIEYVIKGSKLVRVNMNALFQDPAFKMENFIKASNQNFYLGDFDGKNSLKYPLYEIEIAPNVSQELSKNLRSPNASILDFIKEGVRFYIPGSSLKGAIRTAILWNFLQEQNIEKKFENHLKKELIKEQRRGRAIRERFSVSAEKSILGDPNHNLLRALHVRDSVPLEYSSISVEVSKVLSKSGDNSLRWKIFGRERGSIDDYGAATPIFFEAVKPNTAVEGTIKIDEFLLQDEIANSLRIISTEPLKRLGEICNKFAEYHLKREKEFFASIGLKVLGDEMDRILRILNSLKNSEFLLHIAWGTGYEAKALGNCIDQQLFNEIRKVCGIGKEGFKFPKTRKIVLGGDGLKGGHCPKTVPGWVKVRLI